MQQYLLLGAISFVSFMVLADGSGALAQTPVNTNAVYLPDGFDDNDQSQLVIEGVLPSTCYQLTSPAIEKNDTAMTIAIVAQAYVNNGNCAPTPVPFNQEVDLGSLAAGIWKISVGGLDGTEDLRITHSTTSGPDDFIYAPVENARISKDPATGTWRVSLRGKISVSCMDWKEARLIVQSRVLIVLPILEQTSVDCRPTTAPFEREVALPADLAEGRYLVHVRALNGRAINTVFNLKVGE